MTQEPTIDLQRAFYDQRWQGVRFVRGLKLKRCVAILDAVASTKLVEPRIIELGCGTGWLTSILGTLGPAVGVDLADAAIIEASHRYPHVEFVAADILTWNYPRAAFDMVVSHEVLEHVEQQQAYLEVAFGLLREGGYLILTTPNKRTFDACADDESIAGDLQPIEKWVTMGELERMLSGRFSVVRATSICAGYGTRGMYRIVSSPVVRAALRRLGVGWIFDKMALDLGFGLHILAIARRD